MANTAPPFHEIKTAVAAQFQRMSAHNLFRTGADKDAMWTTYLTSWPEGTNPLYRERTEHDCSCCRQFIRAVGDVVAFIDGELISIWDIDASHPAHMAVSNALSALVRSRPIDNVFLHIEASAGTDQNHEQMGDLVKTWEHFHVRLPNSRVCAGKDIGPKLGEARAAHDVLLRALAGQAADPDQNLTASVAISPEAIDTALGLIERNDLYRGQEHLHAVAAFRLIKAAFDTLPPEQRDNWVWAKSVELPPPVSRIRNTSIGTLLVELSEGMEEDNAVRRFEAMVAPANYKRPTALVTPAMVAKAKATVEELGLTSALERRYAYLTDITVNNVLYADRAARRAMAGGAFDGLASTAPMKPASFDKAPEIPVETFLADVLPGATSLELLMENRHAGSLVSLIAPVDPNAGKLFAWDNRFSWSYVGDFADSVKERVKKAGGNVTGELCCRLGWHNFDDLDFHMIEPSGEEIAYFMRRSTGGGTLDVDMNAQRGETRDPVENIYYGSCRSMGDGVYRLFVNQFRTRETRDVGFEAEIDFKGTVHRFSYAKTMKQGENVTVAEFRYTRAGGMEIIKSLPATTASRKVWNIDTDAFQPVSVVLLSPNHWDGHGVGNRHFFFMLAGCENDGTARGFYNEFLRGDLNQHRKVLELVGARMRTDETANQLSGLGFSTTKRDNAIVRVNGARIVRVTF